MSLKNFLIKRMPRRLLECLILLGWYNPGEVDFKNYPAENNDDNDDKVVERRRSTTGSITDVFARNQTMVNAAWIIRGNREKYAESVRAAQAEKTKPIEPGLLTRCISALFGKTDTNPAISVKRSASAPTFARRATV